MGIAMEGDPVSRMVFTSSAVKVGVIIRSARIYDQVKRAFLYFVYKPVKNRSLEMEKAL